MEGSTLAEKKSKRLDIDFDNPYPPPPREVFFDLNNTCNSRCFFCSNHKMKERALLDKTLGFRLLKEFFEFGTREIAFHATGEPFLRQDLADFIRESKRIGYEYVFINTNGILATPQRAKPVLDAGLDSVKFSVNAGSKMSYKQVHGIDCFDTVVKNIKWFYSYRKKSGLKYGIYLSMVVTSKTKEEQDSLRRLISSYIDDLDFRGCSNQGGNILENNLTENIDPKNLLGSLKKGQHTGRCPDIFFRCTVTPQGYLSACVVDYQNYLIMADLNTVSIKDAWHNDSYVALRKRHSQKDLFGTICYNCLNNCDMPAQPLNPEFAKSFMIKKGESKKR